MKVYCYSRVSTNEQEQTQQLLTVTEWLNRNNMKLDVVISDEGVSGGKSYKDRKLNELMNIMCPGDVLIVSEISRLGRSMSDLNKLIADELKHRKIRLIIVSMGIDLDCSNIKASDELLLSCFAFSAQLERELIISRTQSALDAKKAKGQEIGGTQKLWAKHSGMNEQERKQYRINVMRKANQASALKKTIEAANDPINKTFWDKYRIYTSTIQKTDKIDYNDFAAFLNKEGLTTRTGKEFDYYRACNTVNRLKRIYK